MQENTVADIGKKRVWDFMIILFFSAIAIVANILFVWPQAIKILRSKDAEGVSPLTWTISITLFSVFAGYAYSIEYWSLLFANVSCFFGAIIILLVGVTKGGWEKTWLLFALSGFLLAILFMFIAQIVLAILMTLAGVLLRIPQILKLIKSDNVDGVSTTTWLLSGLTASCWLIVSISQQATAVIVANATATIMTIALLTILYIKRKTTKIL